MVLFTKEPSFTEGLLSGIFSIVTSNCHPTRFSSASHLSKRGRRSPNKVDSCVVYSLNISLRIKEGKDTEDRNDGELAWGKSVRCRKEILVGGLRLTLCEWVTYSNTPDCSDIFLMNEVHRTLLRSDLDTWLSRSDPEMSPILTSGVNSFPDGRDHTYQCFSFTCFDREGYSVLLGVYGVEMMTVVNDNF